MGKEAKTNAMRILERAKVAYTAHEYPHEEGVAVDGVTVAAGNDKLMEELGIPAERRLQGLGSNQMAALKAALS